VLVKTLDNYKTLVEFQPRVSHSFA